MQLQLQLTLNPPTSTLYALYAIHAEYLNVYENCIYNKHNTEDLKEFNIINDTLKEFNNYLPSDDQRNKFNDGKFFENILYIF